MGIHYILRSVTVKALFTLTEFKCFIILIYWYFAQLHGEKMYYFIFVFNSNGRPVTYIESFTAMTPFLFSCQLRPPVFARRDSRDAMNGPGWESGITFVHWRWTAVNGAVARCARTGPLCAAPARITMPAHCIALRLLLSCDTDPLGPGKIVPIINYLLLYNAKLITYFIFYKLYL